MALPRDVFSSIEYQLLDFGAGRKLERFGPIILDRPAPAAGSDQPARPQLWSEAQARFELRASRGASSARGRWRILKAVPDAWTIGHGPTRVELKLTAFGHIGVFPEQAASWDWIGERMGQTAGLRLLNLFAHTGGSTLAAAGAGAAVTHVDSARNIVAWSRRNAELSGLSAAPIRWIVDDALAFVRREIKRGRRYDGVILDPPSYGHGVRGQTWKLESHLKELLSLCRELIEGVPRLALLTCHAPDFDSRRLAESLVTAGLAASRRSVEAGDLWLTTADGRRLVSGTFARIASLHWHS
jgi:23S rRNA (cytosine1962-C5)-methyltransferase